MDTHFCSVNDIASLMQFVNEHWSPNHVLAKSSRLMDWQHIGTQGRDYDFVIAKKNGEIFGCLGFILNSRYDPELALNDTVWLVLWKARNDAPKGLGLNLLAFLEKNVQHRWIGTVGNNALVSSIYRALGYRIGTLQQHYTIHPTKKAFNLARMPDSASRICDQIVDDESLKLSTINTAELAVIGPQWREFRENEIAPAKTPRYFIERFIRHPFYDYDLYAIERRGRVQGLIVLRICEAHHCRALRIVDFYASERALPGLATPLQKLLLDYDAEYVDFFQTGFSDEAMQTSGLLTLDQENKEIVIPNFYEPFERTNIPINWVAKLKQRDKFCAYKADADQDRPNHLNQL